MACKDHGRILFVFVWTACMAGKNLSTPTGAAWLRMLYMGQHRKKVFCINLWIWLIEVGIGVKNDPSINFEMLCF